MTGGAADYGLAGESIVCFAGEDWWYHFPHSKNHIMKRLATQNRVLFVNSITMGLPSFSNPDFFLKIRRKLRSYARWLRQVDDLHVLTPITLPDYSRHASRAFNRRLLAMQLRIAMRWCHMRRPILWVATPTAVDVAERIDAKLVVYQVSDKYDANLDSALAGEVIREMDRRLKARAAVVMYSGRRLFEEAEVPHGYFLEQAVDFEHFATPVADIAPEMAAIPKPVLGYFGAMDYVMDVPLIEEVSRLRPQWHWVFVGSKSNLIRISRPNVHFLGPKPYQDLPRYIGQFDVCVLPWSQENVFTSYGSAIKVREYLATGKPVVISPLYEYLKVPGIRIYRTPQEFVEKVEDALRNDTAEDRELRQSAVRNGTWDARTREVGSLLASLIRNRYCGTELRQPSPLELAG